MHEKKSQKISSFPGKSLRVLITGASSGIGAALAVEYAKRGARLVLLARRQSELGKIAQECEQFSQKNAIALCVGDVNSQSTLDAAVKSAVDAWGGLDILVANAGLGVSGRFEKLQLDDYQRQFDTNVWGVLRTVRAGLGEIQKTGGRIVLLGSVMSYYSCGGNSAYTMSKFAVKAFADALRQELRPQGVSVTLVCPGLIQTQIRQVNNAGQYQKEARDPAPAWLLMDAPTAARKIITAVQARRREIVITWHGKLIVWLARFFPGLLARISLPEA